MSGPGRYEVIIAGGGVVGAALAGLLARGGFSVALIESREPPGFDADSDYRLRVSALSPGSRAILRQLGAWERIAAARHRVYRRMEIEDASAGAGTALAFDAPAFGLDCLGIIVENDLLQDALWRVLRANPLVRILCPERVDGYETGPESVEVRTAGGETLRAALLVAADGPESELRRAAGIEQEVWEYNQAGLVCVVGKQEANPGIAWQRFMPGGPLAFLPLDDGRSSIVWTRPTAEAGRLLDLDDAAFARTLDEASAGWLGAVVSTGPRARFPLRMRMSRQQVAGRLVLVGDAAHVVHPLAGQGANLGLADAAALFEALLAGRRRGEEPGYRAGLAAYERWRKSESSLMSLGIHGLGGIFGADSLSAVRRLGLGLVARSWFAREAFVRRAAGLNSNAPRLSRGAELTTLMGTRST